MTYDVDAPRTSSAFGPDRSGRRGSGLRIVTATDVLAPVGGIEVCVFEVCVFEDTTALVARGHHVDLLYTETGAQRADFEMLGVALRGPVRVRFDSRRALRSLASFVRSARRVARLAPDVLWLNRPENIIWAQIVAWLARVPLVVHLHHAPNFRLQSLMVSRVTEFIAVSEYIKGVWVARGIDPARITVVHNAVPESQYPVATEAERLQARERLGVPDGAKVVAYVGRISRGKGVTTLLTAWKALGYAPGEARLVLVGDAVTTDVELARLYRSLPEGTVQHVSNQVDVIPVLHAADLLVAPSEVPESFGRTTVEAMTAGIPAIASDLGGSAEVLADGFERLLVPPADPVTLGARIASLLDWRENEPGLGAAVREHALRRFPYEPHVDALVEILQRHATRRRAGGSAVDRGAHGGDATDDGAADSSLGGGDDR